MKFRTAFALSLLIHLLPFILLILFVNVGNGDKGTRGNKKYSNREQITPKPIDKVTEIEIVKLENNDSLKLKKKSPPVPHKNDKCKYFFGGIGVIQIEQTPVNGQFTTRVVASYKGYPASNAGIRADDMLYTDKDIRGEIGTTVKILVVNRMGTRTVTLVRDKICIDNPFKEVE